MEYTAWNSYKGSGERLTEVPSRSRIVAWVMVGCVFLLPFALHLGFTSTNVVAILWSLWIVNDSPHFSVLSPPNLAPALIFSMIQFVFAFEVVRYCRGQASKSSTIAWGVASQVPVTILGVMNWIAPNVVYSGPLPLSVLVGYYLMRTKGPREPASPWD